MVVLGLETAGNQASMGLSEEKRPLCEIVTAADWAQGEELLAVVGVALTLAQVGKRDLELVSVSAGPGSFTGLRIGISTAKGLARGLGIPVVGVPTLDVYAHKVRFWHGPVWALIPDRRRSVYVTGFRGEQRTIAARAMDLDEMLREAEPGGNGTVLFVGPGAEIHRGELEDRAPDARVASACLNRPSGLAVASLGRARYLQRRRNEYYGLEPLYLQPPPVKPTTSENRG